MSNFTSILELNKIKNNFNQVNEDFYTEYNKRSILGKRFLLKNIKLIRYENEIIGYIWLGKKETNHIIRSLVVKCIENNNNYSYLNAIIKDLVSKRKTYVYNCERNSYNFFILEKLGFRKTKGTFDMALDGISVNKEQSLELQSSNIKFHTLQKGLDEGLRCRIQNEIFKDNQRIPLKIKDIFAEELEEYYYEKGSIFIKYKDEFAGYGQIIFQDNSPYIVNFGILNNFRRLGLGRLLLTYLLFIIKNQGYTSVKLKVSTENMVAINLYKKIGFEVITETAEWKIQG